MKVETREKNSRNLKHVFISKNLPTGLLTPILLDNVLFIAGVDSSTTIPLQVPVVASFNGAIKNVVVNQNTILDGRLENPII